MRYVALILLLFSTTTLSIAPASLPPDIQSSVRQMAADASIKSPISSLLLSRHSKRETSSSPNQNTQKSPSKVQAAEDIWHDPEIGIRAWLSFANYRVKYLHSLGQKASAALEQKNYENEAGRQTHIQNLAESQAQLTTAENIRGVLVDAAHQVKKTLPSGHPLHPDIDKLTQHPFDATSTAPKTPENAPAAEKLWNEPNTGIKAHLQYANSDVLRFRDQTRHYSGDPRVQREGKLTRKLEAAQSIRQIWANAAITRVKEKLPKSHTLHPDIDLLTRDPLASGPKAI